MLSIEFIFLQLFTPLQFKGNEQQLIVGRLQKSSLPPSLCGGKPGIEGSKIIFSQRLKCSATLNQKHHHHLESKSDSDYTCKFCRVQMAKSQHFKAEMNELCILWVNSEYAKKCPAVSYFLLFLSACLTSCTLYTWDDQFRFVFQSNRHYHHIQNSCIFNWVYNFAPTYSYEEHNMKSIMT